MILNAFFTHNVFVFFHHLHSYVKDGLVVTFNIFQLFIFSFFLCCKFCLLSHFSFLIKTLIFATTFLPNLEKSLFFVDCIIHWVIPVPPRLFLPFFIMEMPQISPVVLCKLVLRCIHWFSTQFSFLPFASRWVFFFFFFDQGFLSRTLTTTGQQGRGGDHLLFRSWTLTDLFATLHVRWLLHIFNRTTCIYQTATQWDLPPYCIIIWLCDIKFFCLYTWWFDFSFFATAIWDGKLVDSNSHELSSFYYKWTN